jgi:TolA-binding protein
MILIYSLIVFFTCLIGYQIFLALTPNIVEGIKNQKSDDAYKPYNMNDPNNALILGQQNAGNIEVLKGRIDKLDGVNAKVDTMQQNMDSMQVQIDSLVEQQASFVTNLSGGEPVTVTGQTDEEEEEIV